MNVTGMLGREFDFEKFRLRRFVNQLIELDEVEVRREPVALADLSALIEATPKAVLFTQAGPEKIEMIAKAAGSRKRLIAALGSTPDTVYEDLLGRFANPKRSVEVPSNERPFTPFRLRSGGRYIQAPVSPATRIRR